MTQEEKQLLLKDLYARLPYGVMIEITSDGGMVTASYDMRLDAGLLADLLHSEDDFKPYLRPMSSMTEDEEDELNSARMGNYGEDADWLNAHYFDYHIVPSTGKTLIESGLALEAKKGMYKIKET